MTRIAVLLSGRGTNLQALLDQVHGMDVEIACVASDKEDAPGLAGARGQRPHAHLPGAGLPRSRGP